MNANRSQRKFKMDMADRIGREIRCYYAEYRFAEEGGNVERADQHRTEITYLGSLYLDVVGEPYIMEDDING